jgi:hypothetical protein
MDAADLSATLSVTLQLPERVTVRSLCEGRPADRGKPCACRVLAVFVTDPRLV